MNIHPLIIHFPIACLILYTGIEFVLLFVKSWRDKLLVAKLLLLVVGVVGTFFALQTGEYAAGQLGYTALIETHAEFGEMSYGIYLIILLIYLCRYLLTTKQGVQITKHPIGSILEKIIAFANYPLIIVCIALLGMVLLSITGALGGAISHGPDTDIVVKVIYDLIMK